MRSKPSKASISEIVFLYTRSAPVVASDGPYDRIVGKKGSWVPSPGLSAEPPVVFAPEVAQRLLRRLKVTVARI